MYHLEITGVFPGVGRIGGRVLRQRVARHSAIDVPANPFPLPHSRHFWGFGANTGTPRYTQSVIGRQSTPNADPMPPWMAGWRAVGRGTTLL